MFNPISKLNGRNRLFFDLGVILLFSILAALPVIFNGIPDTRDIPNNFQFAQTFYDSILNGSFYPSWADQPNYGYGDVGVRFYPPLTHYILSLFRYLSGNWSDATCLFVICLYFLSGLGLYLWSREIFSVNASLFGALVYIFLPYHIMQIYVGSVFAEFTAAAILPFCFLFISRVIKNGKLIDISGLAVTIGSLILTNLPITVMASLAFLIYSVFTLKKENFFQTVLKLSVSVGIGLILSSFYWVRMFTELDFIKASSQTLINGEYYYRNRFLFSYLFPFVEVTEPSRSALMDMNATVTIGILVPFLVLYFLKSKKDKQLPSIKNVLAVTGLALLMSVPLSIPVWEVFPVLQKIQFPFRWLAFFSLGCAFIIAAGFEIVVEYFKTQQRYLSILAIGLFVISLPYSYFRMMNTVLVLPKDYLNQMVVKFQTMPSYEMWWAVWATNTTAESAPNSVPGLEVLKDRVVLNNRKFTNQSWLPTKRTFTIEAGEAGQAQIATMYYPHWKAEVNGQTVEVTPTKTGLISLPVTAENSQIELYFQEPFHVITAFYVSGLAWAIFLIYLIINFLQNFRQPNLFPKENV